MNYTRCLLLLFSMMSFFSCKQEKYDITFSSLLDEMVDYEESARFPPYHFLAVRKVVTTAVLFIRTQQVGLPIMMVLG